MNFNQYKLKTRKVSNVNQPRSVGRSRAELRIKIYDTANEMIGQERIRKRPEMLEAIAGLIESVR